MNQQVPAEGDIYPASQQFPDQRVPFIAGHDGIRIDQQGICLDSQLFYSTVGERLRLLSLGNHVAALKKFSGANHSIAAAILPEYYVRSLQIHAWA
jgi:hypothetical protein